MGRTEKIRIHKIQAEYEEDYRYKYEHCYDGMHLYRMRREAIVAVRILKSSTATLRALWTETSNSPIRIIGKEHRSGPILI